MIIYRLFIDWLGQRSTLILLFIINFIGTIYGYIWYKNQLLTTSFYLWPFVPDSPTASLFFTIVLLAFLMHKQWPLLEGFAAITLFKYGIWASVMIIWTGLLGGELVWQHYMLLFSHLGMALQALLYSSYFSFKPAHLLIVAIWTLTNDALDYGLGIFPWLDSLLHPYLKEVCLFTVSLSILSLFIFYLLVARQATREHKFLE